MKVFLFRSLIDHFSLDWLVFSRLLINFSFITEVFFFYFFPYEILDFLFPLIPHFFHSFLYISIYIFILSVFLNFCSFQIKNNLYQMTQVFSFSTYSSFFSLISLKIYLYMYFISFFKLV